MSKIAIITGATSGIGLETARLFAENGFALILTGRRENRLQELKSELAEKYGTKVLTLCFDVRNSEAVKQAFGLLPEEWKEIDVLVNNAGLAAGLDPIQEGLQSDWEQMIDTNIKGLLYVSKAVIPYMIARNTGHIVNLSSIAGREAYANGNVYCATKAGVEFLTKGMRIDLVKHNIKVSSIAPGMVDTEFSTIRFKGDKERADNVYAGLVPLYAPDIADAILYIVTRPPHVTINEMVIMPTAQANATVTNRQ
jgi:3-hydroxy acid dehydrogenase / malonic semialdehyde reductase